MGVSGQLHAPAPVPLGNALPIAREAEWTPRPSLEGCEKSRLYQYSNSERFGL